MILSSEKSKLPERITKFLVTQVWSFTLAFIFYMWTFKVQSQQFSFCLCLTSDLALSLLWGLDWGGGCSWYWSTWHHGLLPGPGLQLAVWWICGLIRAAEAPGSPYIPGPNGSGAINNSPISWSGAGFDVAGRTSVKPRVRVGGPGSVVWVGSHGQTVLQQQQLMPGLLNKYEMQEWKQWLAWKHLRAAGC